MKKTSVVMSMSITEHPRFSVVIPAYNAANYIERTLQSVYDQTYQNYEIVVVDDGSTDSTADILKNQKHPALRVIRQKNGGECSARNRAMAEARGEYLAFLDADDVWMPNHLAVANLFFSKFLQYNWFFTKPQSVCDIPCDDNIEMCINEKFVFTAKNWFLECSNIPLCSSCFVKRTALPRKELFPNGVKIYGDNVGWSRFALLNPMVGMADKPTVYYRLGPATASAVYSPTALGKNGLVKEAFLLEQEMYVSKDCSTEARLFFRFYSLLNWWARIRASSLLPWQKEIRERAALNGRFLTAWLLCWAWLSEVFCRCMGKYVRCQFNSVEKKMACLAVCYSQNLGEFELGVNVKKEN